MAGVRIPGIIISEGEHTLLRFGVFDVDPKSGELRKAGVEINLPPQPAKVLVLLATRAGQLITREELRQLIWGKEMFVDFEHGLNSCIKQIRAALDDHPEAPRYIETRPGEATASLPLCMRSRPVPRLRERCQKDYRVPAESAPDASGSRSSAQLGS